MTVFGKILTFVILLLALAQAGLHVMFHIAQANHIAANKTLSDRITAANAELSAADAEKARMTGEVARWKEELGAALGLTPDQVRDRPLDAVLADATKNLRNSGAELAAANRAVADLTGRLKTAEDTVKTGLDNQQLNQALVQRHQAEVAQMAKAIETRDLQIRSTLEAMNAARDEAVKAKVIAKDLQFRNEQMVAKVAEMEKENVTLHARLKSPGGGGFGGPLAGGPGSAPGGVVPGGAGGGLQKNPPRDNVEGTIKQTDPAGLVTVSIGSDAGVVRGNTLEVFRLSPPKYLGTIRITDARPNEAVGKPVSKPLGPIMPGDRVASKILPN
jgi:hypothetical protein